MCGITGFVDPTDQSDMDILRRMTDVQTHRGPDDAGYEIYPHTHSNSSGRTGFGQRRLKIIDLSASARQPMRKHGLSIVFNGEIYNYREIRDELTAIGETFFSHSDTEVILSAFHRWGVEAVHRFIGMFAFAIRDEAKGCLYLFRDRAGVKPLYYAAYKRLFIFTSELKSLHQHPLFRPEIDLSSLGLFFQYGYINAPYSIFQNVRKLLPGHFLIIDEKSLEYQERTYWSVYDCYNKPKFDIPFEEASDELERIFKSAFKYRMVSDVPVGVFLSGGYDSSLVTGMLQSDMTDRLKTFTIGFNEDRYNEAPYARKVAEYLDTDHTEYICSEDEALKIIPKLPFYFDEPFGDVSSISTILVSKLARKEVTVALSADAGDESFAGYGKYELAQTYQRRFSRIPEAVRRILTPVLSTLNPEAIPLFNNSYNFPTRYGKVLMLLQSKDILRTLDIIGRDFVPSQLEKLIPNLGKQYDAFPSAAGLNEHNDLLNVMLAADYRTYMVDDVLVKVDRSAMAVSLEGREPLIDHRIIEFASRLPSQMKLKDGTGKYILRHIAHKYVPREILERPKMGFAVPVKKWMRGALKPFLLDYISSDRIRQRGILDPDQAIQIRDRYLSGDKENANKVWFLLMYQMWEEEFFN